MTPIYFGHNAPCAQGVGASRFRLGRVITESEIDKATLLTADRVQTFRSRI